MTFLSQVNRDIVSCFCGSWRSSVLRIISFLYPYEFERVIALLNISPWTMLPHSMCNPYNAANNKVGAPTWNSCQAFLGGARWCLEMYSVGCVLSLGTIIFPLCIIPTATIVCRNLTGHGVPLNPWVSVLQHQYNIIRSNGKNQLKSVIMLKRNVI